MLLCPMSQTGKIICKGIKEHKAFSEGANHRQLQRPTFSEEVPQTKFRGSSSQHFHRGPQAPPAWIGAECPATAEVAPAAVSWLVPSILHKSPKVMSKRAPGLPLEVDDTQFAAVRIQTVQCVLVGHVHRSLSADKVRPLHRQLESSFCEINRTIPSSPSEKTRGHRQVPPPRGPRYKP
jgi:hypothetical protein